jgi:hypothetical protein
MDEPLREEYPLGQMEQLVRDEVSENSNAAQFLHSTRPL